MKMSSLRTPAKPSPWMRLVVAGAAAHALYTAAFASSSIDCAGLWVAVAAGLAIAAVDPLRFWPGILVGLLARIVPPVAFALSGKTLSTSAIVSDAIWWVPLSLILAAAYFLRLDKLRERSPDVLGLALRARTSGGITIEQISRTAPVLVVFLRHAGCTFCREALADLATQRRGIEASGVTIVLAHMGDPDLGRGLFRKYGLEDLQQISDPGQCLYRAFGLSKGDWRMLFGPKVWWRGFEAAILRRHGLGRPVGDGLQMPGIFLIFHGQVIRSFRHQSAADRPDYTRFVTEDSFSRMVL